MANNPIITKELVKDIFCRANSRFFNNILPTPKFEITKNRMQLGQFRAYYGEYTIKVSSYYKFTTNDLETVVIHEMIHLWQHVVYGTSNHGTTFRNKAYEIRIHSNNEYDINRTTNGNKFVVQDESQMKNRIYAVFHQDEPGDIEYAWVCALSRPMYDKFKKLICFGNWELNTHMTLIGFVYDRYEHDFDSLPALQGRFTRNIRGKRIEWSQFCDKYYDFTNNITKKLK